MRIIRPQQLVVLKSSYQIGHESHMGISVVAGCYLSKPEHMVTESQIWQAWKAAPLSFRMLDSAEPKPFAEFLLAGHAGIGEEVTSLSAEVSVGSLTRRWCIEGESNKTGLVIKPFLRMSMDHTQSWGGKGCKENPLGRGYNDERKPTIMSLGLDGSAIVRSPLASPSPVPHDFQLRKVHINEVASTMTDPQYLETFYPGLPPQIDRRYFQMAPPGQWLKKSAWPDSVPFKLIGFRPDNEEISGAFPAVSARAFVWDNPSAPPSEVTLLRKTLWLLPDNDMGLMVFTGSVPLTHLFDEPIDTLLVGLDDSHSLRELEYYQQVYKSRSVEGAASFEFLKDPELMPEGMPLNVIRDLADHPDSLRYSASAMSEAESERFYQDVQDAIDRQEQQKSEEQETLGDLNVPAAGKEEAGTQWLESKEDTATNVTFLGTDFSGMTLDNKQFRYCMFTGCHFDKATFKDCTFEHCQFTQSDFENSRWNNVHLSGCLFKQAEWQKAAFTHCKWEKSTFEYGVFKHAQFTDNALDNCLINHSDFSLGTFDHCTLNGCFFSETHCDQTQFNQVIITSCIFEKCDGPKACFTESTIEKTSFISSSWVGVRLSHCYLNSLTTGLNTNLSESHFEQCSLNKMGFLKVNLQSSTFINCSMLESCCDKADFSQATLIACDMTAVRLKDANLVHSHWQNTSLQQSMFYNADLRDATFQRCNLAGANLAMISQNMDTRFEHCLTEKTHWIPRRYTVPA
ncbi:pentapeptide repeats family protein [Yersinia pseudotuberculosis IP 32953]|uniref:DUF2169 domain-containing protein n=2 Tax=Yersinia pseudotuberculosis TaxID=633 RepID=Q66EP3_YERPS|nr:pentapeptide repeat-containing protein [Yersinia pseudotuberculosis]CQD49978.1 pentapeptide repeat-containing protein [Yersinia intermedia]AJJ03301.1 pentapeptide repeats family protein [Yersinia pseudotuberculosis]AJJ53314.1 pentapeptide repeats family protein [Yersinia pseudotuberculosis IP 32953]AJJ68932.1 pentapeptide repeats family protein [Yersinia pseudotuberculosis PB1/+]AYW90514.1 DUF2169 domain-containing protein [Yersinia pseudotuberculosis]